MIFKLPPIKGSLSNEFRESPILGTKDDILIRDEKSMQAKKTGDKLLYNQSDEAILTPMNDSNIEPVNTDSPKENKDRKYIRKLIRTINFGDTLDDNLVWKSVNGVPHDNKAMANKYSVFNDSNIIINDFQDSQINSHHDSYIARVSNQSENNKDNEIEPIPTNPEEKESSLEGMSTIFEIVDKNEIELVEGSFCKCYKTVKVYTSQF